MHYHDLINLVLRPKQWRRVSYPVHDTYKNEQRNLLSGSPDPFLVSGPWNPAQSERRNDLRQGYVIETGRPQTCRDDEWDACVQKHRQVSRIIRDFKRLHVRPGVPASLLTT